MSATADAGRARLGVLISGRGSNLQALIHAIERGELDAEIGVVISNRSSAGGLDLARAAGIETVVLDHRQFATREDYDERLAQELHARSVTLICLAGFMRLVSPRLLDAFPDAVLNIHPSLLPSFPGVDAQQQALAHGVKVTGATVHLVTQRARCGADRAAGGGAGSGRRHDRDAVPAHPRRGTSHLSGRGGGGAGGGLAGGRTSIPQGSLRRPGDQAPAGSIRSTATSGGQLTRTGR